MYTNWKLTYCHIWCLSNVGCATGTSSGEGPSLVIKAHTPLLRMPLNVQGSLPVHIPACLCSRAGLSLYLLKLRQQGCSMLTPCILDALVVSLVCGRSLWPLPTLLDVLMGDGLCPLGEGLCLLGPVCPPSVWALPAQYPFSLLP